MDIQVVMKMLDEANDSMREHLKTCGDERRKAVIGVDFWRESEGWLESKDSFSGDIAVKADDESESLEDMNVRVRRERMEEFFRRGNDRLTAIKGLDHKQYFTIEALYQAFKERMIMEIEK